MRLTTLLLKHRFMLFFLVLALLSAVVVGALNHLESSVAQLKSVEEQRYRTSVLANDLKMKTDAMTRNVMAFVSSEQPEFQENYRTIVRELRGQAPDAQGITLHALDRFSQAGIVKDEIETLRAAFEQIEALTVTQIEAMNTASGQFDDGQGNVKVALPNALMAKVMVFSQQYTEAAHAIQETINRFDAQQVARMNALAEHAQEATQQASAFALAALTALLAGSAVALWTLYLSVKRPLDAGIDLATRLADGQLDARTPVRCLDETGRLLTALNSIGAALSVAVSNVRTEAVLIDQAAATLAQSHAELAHRTDEQAANVQESVAATEQLAATVHQNTLAAQTSRDLIQQAADAAHTTRQIVAQAVQSMQEIERDSGKINEITSVINSIAFQTNILALNAAIEAARAGQHGRGFAVVAGEVRNLATRSAGAARDIETLITHSISQLKTGSIQVNKAGDAMDSIVTNVSKTRALMADVVAASQEQTQGIESIAQAMNHLEEITQQNSLMVREAATATHAQETRVQALTRTLEGFQLDEENFTTMNSAPQQILDCLRSNDVIDAEQTNRFNRKKLPLTYEKPYVNSFDMAAAHG